MSDESEQQDVPPVAQKSDSARRTWFRTFKATATRRALLLTALGGLLIAGLITVVPVGSDATGLAAYLAPETAAPGGRSSDAFRHATPGSCLTWPDNTPDAATIVDCKDDHRFEVAQAIDMSTFPGSEYGPDAAPRQRRASSRSVPSSARPLCSVSSAANSTRTADSR